MFMNKRDLPPLSALRAFEAAARHMSFRAAAEELGLTQTAISHQVAALEEHFATRLFDRAGRRVALSEAGRLFFPFVRDGFDRVTQGTDLLRRSRMSEDLRVQVYVTVAVRWLIVIESPGATIETRFTGTNACSGVMSGVGFGTRTSTSAPCGSAIARSMSTGTARIAVPS